MKKTWLFKLSILATALAMLTGCPALSNLMELITREQEKPKKTLTITGLGEYEGKLIQVMASDSSDTLGERLCLSGGNVNDRIVKGGDGKTLILEMNAQKANTNISAFTTIAKNMMGIAKSCDDRERIVMFSVFSSDSLVGENQDANALMEKVMNNTFIYTKGVNICNASADILSNTKITYSFSGMESTLKFSDFMRASDCEMLMDIFNSLSNESEEYIVIKETDSLDVIDIPSLKGNVKAKFTLRDTINVILPKETKETDGYLWTKVYYKKGSKEIGWVTEQTLPGTTKTTVATQTPNQSNFAAAPAAPMPSITPMLGPDVDESPTVQQEAECNSEFFITQNKWKEYTVTATTKTRKSLSYENDANDGEWITPGHDVMVNLGTATRFNDTLWGEYYTIADVILKREIKWIPIKHLLLTGLEEYFVVDPVKIRDKPTLDGDGISLSRGEIIAVVLPKIHSYNHEGKAQLIDKERKKEVDANYTLTKICYNGNIKWIAEKCKYFDNEVNKEITEYNILPNESIVTSRSIFPEELHGKDKYGNYIKKVGTEKDMIVPLNWGGWRDLSNGEKVKQYGDRYEVAVAPKILNPYYPDNGKIWNDDFYGFSRFIDVVVRYVGSKELYTIKCIVTDQKAHSYNEYPNGHIDEPSKNVSDAKVYDQNGKEIPNGIMQTGIRYPRAVQIEWENGKKEDPVEIENMNDGSVIEFYGAYIDSLEAYNGEPSNVESSYGERTIFNGRFRGNINNKFELVKIISNIHRDKECFFKKQKLKEEGEECKQQF
jgi:hypothetical protein